MRPGQSSCGLLDLLAQVPERCTVLVCWAAIVVFCTATGVCVCVCVTGGVHVGLWVPTSSSVRYGTAFCRSLILLQEDLPDSAQVSLAKGFVLCVCCVW